MKKFLKKRVVFLFISVAAFVISFMSFIFESPKAYAATEQLLYQLTLSDILANTNNLSSTTSQGSKGVWYWKGIKSLDTNSLEFNGNGESIFFWFGIDENSTDENLNRVTKLEWSFTASRAGAVMILCGDYSNVKQSIKNGENNISLSGFVSKYNYFKFDIDGGTYTPSTLTAFDMKLYYTPGAAATITAGTGVDSVFVSNSSNATSGSNSGTSFDDGSTVYGYAKLKTGYEAPSTWTYVGNADYGQKVYRIGSRTITNCTAVDFGTVNATPMTKTITLNNNGGVGTGEIELTYNQSAQAPSTGFSRELFTFDGWNTKADGTGLNLTTELSKWDVNDLILSDYMSIYAKWKINASGVMTLINNIGTVEFTSTSKGKIDEARAGYESLSDTEKAEVTNYQTLTDAENTYADLLNQYGEVKIGNKIYPTIKDAYDALNEGETIVLRKDLDLSNEHITIEKNVNIDLNGNVLKTTMEDGATGTPNLLVTTNDTIVVIKNSEPDNGGVDGVCIIDTNVTDSYIKFYDSRLTIPAETITDYLSDVNVIAPGYEIVNINKDGSPDENGFISIVQPLDIFDLENLTEDYLVPDGQTLTGYLDSNVKISIPDGATITLSDALILGSDSSSYNWAGLTCLGDATIILEGNNVVRGFYNGAGIYVPEGHTLIIDGAGKLEVDGGYNGAGIGGNQGANSGNIIINNGYIVVTGGTNAAAIGGGYSTSSNLTAGNITINGGAIVATAGENAAAIGSANGESCGDITINGGYVNASETSGAAAIGTGIQGSCDDITIEGTVVKVIARANSGSNQIGAGSEGTCSNVIISTDLTSKVEYNTTRTLYHDKSLLINGSFVNDSNSSGEGWSYDKETNTLTLNNFEYEGPATIYTNEFNHEDDALAAIISYDGSAPLIINLVGENTIINTTDNTALIDLLVIHSATKLNFTGNGSLYVSFTGKNNLSTFAIGSGSKMTIDGPSIIATGGKSYYSEGIRVRYDEFEIISGSVFAMGDPDSENGTGINTNNYPIKIGENTKSFVAIGTKNALGFYTTLKNAIEGTGWTDINQTEGEFAFAVDFNNYVDNYKYVEFINISAEDVIGLINDIGDVEYTNACKEKIDEARAAYNFLKPEEQALVTNYNDLVFAEETFASVDAVVVKINAIGEVEYTNESKALIDEARTAYNNLNARGKVIVVNITVLTNAEVSYKEFDDNYKSSQVIVLINNIGTVTYTTESKTKINTAKEAYDALSAEGKALVTNYQTLTYDIQLYDHVDNVYKMIEAIKDVKYDDLTEEELEAARTAYDSLTEEEKQLVTNYDKLTEDEKTYSGLRNDHKTFVGWMVTLGIMGGIILALVIAYFLLFFTFHKWTLVNDDPARVFVIGKKDDKERLLTMTLMIIYREKNEVVDRKDKLDK